jgi:2-polyprenyl-3-methyl-5-hydroxy-6-metoxy-1,4-benzoquinol methylase
MADVLTRCPVCGSAELRKFDVTPDIDGNICDILMCVECGALLNSYAYVSLHGLTAEQIQKTDLYAVTSDDPPSLHLQEVEQADSYFQYLADCGIDASRFGDQVFCDFGAGRGYVALAACRRFRSVIAQDWDTRGVSKIRDSLRSMGSDYTNLDIVDDLATVQAKIDVLFMWHVLEHLPEPTEFWRSHMHRLSEDALIYLQIPLYRRAALCRPHFVFYTERSLERWASEIGFRPINFGYDPERGFLGMIAARGETGHGTRESAPGLLEVSVAQRYFSDSELGRITIEPGQLVIRDFIFNVHLSSNELAVASFPPDEWLLAQQPKLTRSAFAWEAVAHIKTKILHSPEEVLTKARTGELYDEDYYLRRGGGAPYVGYPVTVYGDYLAQEFREIAAEVSARFAGAKVLDLGCGPGVLVREMQEIGLDAHGVDISRWCFETAVTVEIHHGSALALPFGDSTFDLQISQDVMEHIHPDDLDQALREQIRVSRPGGRVCHFIPFYDYAEPISMEAHLCNANKDWWLRLFGGHPELTIEQMAPDDQADVSEGRLSRYFVLKVNKEAVSVRRATPAASLFGRYRNKVRSLFYGAAIADRDC